MANEITKVGARNRVVLAAVVATAFTLSCTASSLSAAETPKAQPAAKAKAAEQKAKPGKPEPISLDDYLAGIYKPGLPAADQAAFAKKHTGATVTWTGYLQAVNKNMSPDGMFFMLILKQSLGGEGKPVRFFLAKVDGSAEKDVMSIQKDQKVTVTGTLTVENNPAVPTLANAKLSGS